MKLLIKVTTHQTHQGYGQQRKLGTPAYPATLASSRTNLNNATGALPEVPCLPSYYFFVLF